ncbi:MAG: hypothetical protein GY820_05480, partial [Gammaproteobacteria bacterium]|nr:hypothetical protein [Gammaproteobacteria bacterium]
MTAEETASAARDQRNLKNNVGALTNEVAGLTTTINAQRTEFNQNFQTLESRLEQVENPQVMQLTGGRNTDALQNYDGDSDFDDWLSLFLRVKEAYGWSDAKTLKILPAYLRGNAADLYAELDNAQKSTLNDLTTNLRSALEPDEMARITQNKLVKRRMKPYETIVEFAAEIQRLVRSAYRKLPADVQATLMRDLFIEKVIPDIKRYLLLLDPKDFATAKRKAMQIETHNTVLEKDVEDESTERRRGDRKPKVLATQVEKDDLRSMMTEVLKELRSQGDAWKNPTDHNERWNSNQSRGSMSQYRGRNPRGFQGSPRGQYGWRGANRGYEQRPVLRNQGTPSGRIVCFKCGRYNHTAAVCPQNRGRTFGGNQPFWRSQNSINNVLPIEQAVPTTVNGCRAPYVYQLAPVPMPVQQHAMPPYQNGCGDVPNTQLHGYLEVEQTDHRVCMMNPDKTDHGRGSKEDSNEKLEQDMEGTESDPYLTSLIAEPNPEGLGLEFPDMTPEVNNAISEDQGEWLLLPRVESLEARCERILEHLKSIQQKAYSDQHPVPMTEGGHQSTPVVQQESSGEPQIEHTVDYEEDLESAMNFIRESQDDDNENQANHNQEPISEDHGGLTTKENIPPLSSIYPRLLGSSVDNVWRHPHGTPHVLQPLRPPIDTDGQLSLGGSFIPLEGNLTIKNSKIYMETDSTHDQGNQLLQQHTAESNNSSTSTLSATLPPKKWKNAIPERELPGCVINSTRLKSAESSSSLNQKSYIWDPYQEEATISDAYSSDYWVGYASWPDLSLPTPQPARSNKFKRWKSCSCLFLYIIALLMVWVAATQGESVGKLEIAPQPMLCQTNKGGTLWRLPKLPSCHLSKDYKSSKMYTETLHLYKRNIIKYESKAYHCKIIYREIQAFTYLFANRRLKKEMVIERPVGLEECKRMVKFKRCEYGLMTLNDGMWMTTNELKWDYPAGFFKCCTWVKHYISNCYLLETKVYKAHSDKSMDGLIAGIDHCDYHHGGCALKQGSALIWEPNKTEQCEFIFWRIIKGEGLGNSWLAMDHNIALTRTTKFIRSCGETLFLSKQGIAYKIKKRIRHDPLFAKTRNKRQTTTNGTGVVLTPQLSAQLQALEIVTRRNINFAFRCASASVCHNMNSMMTYMTHIMLAQPTSAVRALLNKSTLTARAGFNIIEVFPCAELSVDA